jgi:hypothetical protein
MTSSNGYLRTDELRETVEALRKVADELEAAQTDSYAWKWAIIAMQNAVQNAIVAAISGTDQLGALTKKAAREWLEAYEKDRADYPEPWLANFLELYDRMKSRTSFPATAEIDRDIMRLVEFRNDFMHFTPKGWSIQVAGLPRILLTALTVVEHLGWKGHILWYEEADQTAAHGSVERIRGLLDRLDSLYSPEA